MAINDRAGDGEQARPRYIRAAAIAAGLAIFALVAFVVFMGLYRAREYRLPIGFDAPWYVWRAELVGAGGLGLAGTESRPGHAVLSAVLGSVTGLTQLQLAVVLPLLLVPVFALSMGGFVWSAFGANRWRWVAAMVLAAGVLGSTRLVAENVATLLTLTLVLAALVPLLSFAAGGRGWPGATLMLVAAGLVHWLFLAVVGAVLGVAFLAALPEALRARREGSSLARTEAGAIATVGASVVVAMAGLIGLVLRAPINTIDVPEDPARFLPKLTNDIRRVFAPLLGPVAAAGAWLLARPRNEDLDSPDTNTRSTRPIAMRLLASWVLVAVAGLIFGMLTLDLPPHRFFELLVAVPVVVALAEAVVAGATWLLRRWGSVTAGLFFAVAVSTLCAPGIAAWYRTGPAQWLAPGAFHQARTAAVYLEEVPVSRPVVFVVGPRGPAGTISVFLKERTIRAALPPERQAGFYLFVGDPSDLLAGRRTVLTNPRVDETTLPFWEATHQVLDEDPVILVLKDLAAEEFAAGVDEGEGEVISPGVLLVRGPPPDSVPVPEALPPPVPPLRVAAFRALLILLVLGAAGAGWAMAMLPRGSPAELVASLALAFGTGALVLIGLVAAKLGLELSGPAGVATWGVAAAAGYAVAWRSKNGR